MSLLFLSKLPYYAQSLRFQIHRHSCNVVAKDDPQQYTNTHYTAILDIHFYIAQLPDKDHCTISYLSLMTSKNDIAILTYNTYRHTCLLLEPE